MGNGKKDKNEPQLTEDRVREIAREEIYRHEMERISAIRQTDKAAQERIRKS